MAGSPKVGEYLCRPGGGSGRFSPLAGPSPEGEGTGHHPRALLSALPPSPAPTAAPAPLLLSQGELSPGP